MNGTQLSIYHPSTTPPLPVVEEEISPEIKRGAEILGALVVGSISGYIVYWINRLIARLGWLGEGAVVQPLPYVLAGLMSAAIVETARLVHDAALYTLGDRDECERVANSDEATSFDYLRQKAWKVITYAEQAQKDIDVIYSRLFNIRTAEQIRTKYTTEKDYYLSNPRFMEVARRAFLEQAAESFKTAVPQELGVYAAEAMGYTVLGGHLFVWLHGILFFNGLIDKIGKVYQKIEIEEIKEIKRRRQEAENKKNNDMLETLYPDEIAKLDNQTDDPEALVGNPSETEKSEMEDCKVEHTESDDEVTAENHPFGDNVIFIQGDELDLRDYKDWFDYRHTVFQSTYPINGFPVKDEEGAELDQENDPQEEIEIQKGDLPDDFVLAKLK